MLHVSGLLLSIKDNEGNSALDNASDKTTADVIQRELARKPKEEDAEKEVERFKAQGNK
eukprot:gene7013-16744_t